MNFKRNSLVLSIAAAAVLAAAGCAEKKAEEAPAPAAEPAAPAPAVTADSSFDDKVAYSIGASVGGYIAQMVEVQGEFLGEVNIDLVHQGFRDALSHNSALTAADIEETLKTLDQQVAEKMKEKAAAEAQANLEAGKKFLEENAAKEGVQTTASGLQYKVITAGEGRTPTATDVISVKYRGTTIDGAVFDEQTEPVDFPLGNMIPGWVEGLQLMPEGSVYELYVPSELAYGSNGAGNIIKPNSVLIFNVELVQIKTPAAEEGDGEAEAAAAAEVEAEEAAAGDAAAK